jgi:hypothetical protein
MPSRQVTVVENEAPASLMLPEMLTEVSRIGATPDDVMRGMIDDEDIVRVRQRKLNPDAPGLRGTAQSAGVFFQARETASGFDVTARADSDLKASYFLQPPSESSVFGDRMLVANAAGCSSV